MVGFENVEQEQEVWSFLKQKFIPLKFGYVGNAAYTHDKLAFTDAYDRAIKLDKDDYLKTFLQQLNISTIMDVGSGNGNNSSKFIDELMQCKLNIFNYFCCDFSNSLSKLCISRLEKKYPFIKFEQVLWDIENEKSDFLLKYLSNENVLLVLLGNTIGNVIDVEDVLRNIYNSARAGDKFILEVSIKNNNIETEKILEDYNNSIFIQAATESLRMVGIDTNKGNHELYYDKKREAVVVDFIFDDKVVLSHGKEEITFYKGNVINSFISRRMKKESIKDKLNFVGWKIANIIENEKNTVALFFCEK